MTSGLADDGPMVQTIFVMSGRTDTVVELRGTTEVLRTDARYVASATTLVSMPAMRVSNDFWNDASPSARS